VKNIFRRSQASLALSALLGAQVLSVRAQIITDDDPGLQSAEALVVMIDGRFNEPTQGAGVVFAVDKGYVYIATVFHVVRKSVSDEDITASDITVRFRNDPLTPVPAEYVKADSARELAVIRAKAAGVTFNFARIGDMERVKNGLPAYAIGQPAKDWGVTYSPGPVSDVGATRLEVQSSYIQHGHSGGALIDQQGRIIGIVNDTDGSTAGALRIDHVIGVLRLDLKLPVQLEAAGELTNLARVAPMPVPSASPIPGASRANPKDGLTYRWIPPGTFRMGCSEQPVDKECGTTEEFPTHDVTISKGFWMGETEVTQEAYGRVTGTTNPSDFKDPRRPVESVSWDEAKAYCAAAGGMRLPTEAEWEYAARAGTRSASYGDLRNIAWYNGNSDDKTHEVGLKPANAWNLRDMLGNVWEWTADWYASDYYKNSPSTDPQGPTEGEYRVLRGGSWNVNPEYVRVSDRHGFGPSVRNDFIGFRCAGELS
jgi:formylglycine-generating enzyme required for sulfatase activity